MKNEKVSESPADRVCKCVCEYCGSKNIYTMPASEMYVCLSCYECSNNGSPRNKLLRVRVDETTVSHIRDAISVLNEESGDVSFRSMNEFVRLAINRLLFEVKFKQLPEPLEGGLEGEVPMTPELEKELDERFDAIYKSIHAEYENRMKSGK